MGIRKRNLLQMVPMPKNKMIYFRLFCKHFTSVNDEEFLFSKKVRVFFTICKAAFLRKKMGEASRKVRVEAGEKPLVNAARKDALHELIAVISRPQAIAMGEVIGFAKKGPNRRFMMYFSSYFLWEKIPKPEVVVTRKYFDRNTLITHLGKLAEQADVATRLYVFIFKPEVENITK